MHPLGILIYAGKDADNPVRDRRYITIRDDALGHAAGNALLVEVARRISACVRASEHRGPARRGHVHAGAARVDTEGHYFTKPHPADKIESWLRQAT